MWETIVTQRDNVGNCVSHMHVADTKLRNIMELYVSQNIVNYAVQEAETQTFCSDSSNSERQCGER